MYNILVFKTIYCCDIVQSELGLYVIYYRGLSAYCDTNYGKKSRVVEWVAIKRNYVIGVS